MKDGREAVPAPAGTLIARAGFALWGEHWQGEMARVLGIHRDTVQDWRQGRRQPNPGVWRDLRRIAVDRQRDIAGVLAELPPA